MFFVQGENIVKIWFSLYIIDFVSFARHCGNPPSFSYGGLGVPNRSFSRDVRFQNPELKSHESFYPHQAQRDLNLYLLPFFSA